MISYVNDNKIARSHLNGVNFGWKLNRAFPEPEHQAECSGSLCSLTRRCIIISGDDKVVFFLRIHLEVVVCILYF